MKVRLISIRLALCGVVFVGGCLPTQQSEVNLYRSLLDERLAPENAPAPDETLSLSRAMALANQHDEQLASRGEDYVQAIIQKHRIVMNFLPTVTLQPTFTIEDAPSGTAANQITDGNNGAQVVTGSSVTNASTVNSGFKVVGSTLQRTEVPAVGELNIFRGFGDIASLKAAASTIEERKLLLYDLQSTIMLNVAQTYYQVLRSEKQVGVLKDSLRLQEERLREVTDQFNHGLAIKLSVAQSEAQRDATIVSLTQAESDVRNGRSTLAYLIGVRAVPNPLIDDYKLPGLIDAEKAFEARAQTEREDLLASNQGIKAAKHNVDVAISEYYPSINIDVAGFAYREFYADASKWNAILYANIPIFSAGAIESDVRDAWSALRQAMLSASQTERVVMEQVQISYDQFMTSKEKYKELESQVAASQEAYDQSLSAYHNGLGINLDVLTAQDQLLDSQLQLASAGFDRTVFYLSLLRSTGEIVPEAKLLATHASL